jgi:hypothetical protein
MRATGPTARSARALAHLVKADRNPPISGFVFLGRCNPADPFIPCQRCDIRPRSLHDRVGLYRLSKIRGHSMYSASVGVRILLRHDVRGTQEPYLVAPWPGRVQGSGHKEACSLAGGGPTHAPLDKVRVFNSRAG